MENVEQEEHNGFLLAALVSLSSVQASDERLSNYSKKATQELWALEKEKLKREYA